MSDEDKQQNSGSKRRGGKRRYFRRNRRKNKQGEQDSAKNSRAQERGDDGQSSRRKKRRSRRRRTSRRQRRQEEQGQVPRAVDVPVPEDYVEPDAVFVYTHVVRPAYREAYSDYRPEALASGLDDVGTFHAETMDRLRKDIRRQLDEQFDTPPVGGKNNR